jgi:ribosomal protein S18 acetylase RimI-like enzyme
MTHQPQSMQLIRFIEELAANAWPAEIVQVVDSWRLRFNQGVTRRANSVWPNETGNQQTLKEKLALVEDFYTRRDCPPRYHICPAVQPTNLDKILANHGYTSDARTAVQTASLETILNRTGANPAHSVAISHSCRESWFDLYCYGEHVSPHTAAARRGILQRIGPHTGFATLQIDGQPAAVGLGVVERGWLGLFSLVTHPDFRRQGAAISLIHALAQWGQAHQAGRVYLQVMTDNAPALTLYARLGFETLYHYHYRELVR